MIEAREIEAFLAVAEELHFGRAAARLHLSPTRISQTVQALVGYGNNTYRWIDGAKWIVFGGYRFFGQSVKKR